MIRTPWLAIPAVAAMLASAPFALAQSVASVTVSAGVPSILVDTSTQLTATVRDNAGNVLAGRPIAWSVNDAAIASVSQSGLLTGILPGQSVATATVEGVTGSAAVTVRAPALERGGKWFTGHIGGAASDLYPERSKYGWGYSWYIGVHPLKPNRDELTQLGVSTWMQANNVEDANDAYSPRPPGFGCPPSALASYFYDANEGGVGSWGDIQFPTAMPKYTITAAAGCFLEGLFGIGGPAYSAGGGKPLPASGLWFAQLSNRMLLSPDRINFQPTTTPQVFGYGWVALPIIPANTSPFNVPTGPNTWTLTFNSANFKGLIGFFTPAFYSASLAQGANVMGYTLDVRPAIFPGPALEVGFAPWFENTVNGVLYRRIPRMTFGAGPDRRAMLAQDYTYFSKGALWDQVAAWVAGGPPVTAIDLAATRRTTLSNDNVTVGFLSGVGVEKEPVDFAGMFGREVFLNEGGAQAFGLSWGPTAEAGVIPEYYRKEGAGWKAIPRAEVPRRTWLEDQTFPSMKTGTVTPLDTGPSSPWAQSGWAAGPFTTRLTDGSALTYVWYRFIDQPAIKRLNLTEAQRLQLQAWAVSVHQTGSSVFSIAAPSNGSLVSIDTGHLVTPPPGLEAGYVPIAIAQQAAPALSVSSIDFGGQLRNSASAPRSVTITNPGSTPFTVTSVSASGAFSQTHNCTTLVGGASCAIQVRFAPTALGAINGAITIQTSLGPNVVALSGAGADSLVSHYYNSILRRAPDAGGQAFWDAEAVRVAGLGANVNEVWFAMAQAFFFSAEYAGLNRDNTGFVADLYTTFFNRAPDSGGQAFWLNNLAGGMPREVALTEFMFSTEFRNFTQARFGTPSVRAEINAVTDFYRALLARLPDDGGFGFWLARFRAAQCAGPAAIVNEVESISSQFALSAEYGARARSNAQYVGDLYNAFLRRGGDLAGVQFWIAQLASSAQTREQLRVQFKNSPEFQARVQAIIAQGCLG